MGGHTTYDAKHPATATRTAATASRAVEPTGSAQKTIAELMMARAWLSDREFAALLRTNDYRYAPLLEAYGWHGSWVSDADYVRDYETVIANFNGPQNSDKDSPLPLHVAGQGLGRSSGGTPAPDASAPLQLGPAPTPQSTVLSQVPTSPDFGDVQQSLDLQPQVSRTTSTPTQTSPLALEQVPNLPGVGQYRHVAGDHVHQNAARTQGPGAPRNSAPEYRGALSVSTQNPNYNDPAGQLVEKAINRAAHGADYNAQPSGPSGTVHVEATGNTTLGTNRTATPSQWFEDIKSYYKLREAGMLPHQATQLVFSSARQLSDAGATPRHVPGAPRTATPAAKAGQTLSGETPTILEPQPTPAPSKTGPAATPQEAPIVLPRGAGTAIREGAGAAYSALSNLALIGQTLDDLRNNRPAHAAKNVGIAALTIALVTRFPKLGPIGLALGVLAGYGDESKETANNAGSWVEKKTGSRVAGAFAASGTALVASAYHGLVEPVGQGISKGAMFLAPTHARNPDLGPDQLRFKAQLEGRKHGCQNCHDAVAVDNWMKEHGRAWMDVNGPATKSGFPTDAALKFFEANAHPLNERAP